MTEGRRQNTKRSRYTALSVFYNLIINTLHPEMRINVCHSREEPLSETKNYSLSDIR